MKLQLVFGVSDRHTRFAQATLVTGVCLFNLSLYVAFFRYGSTMAMARKFVPFLID